MGGTVDGDWIVARSRFQNVDVEIGYFVGSFAGNPGAADIVVVKMSNNAVLSIS